MRKVTIYEEAAMLMRKIKDKLDNILVVNKIETDETKWMAEEYKVLKNVMDKVRLERSNKSRELMSKHMFSSIWLLNYKLDNITNQ